jgi:hypothetical protein
MAKRKSMISIDSSNFASYAEKLDKLGANLQKVFTEAMEQAAEKVSNDTIEAMASGNLPAGGKYSQGETEASIIRDAKVVWHGSVGTIGVGFDKTKPGAGGFLITGTPKMKPNYRLEDIYSRRKYENDIKKDIIKVLQNEIDRIMGG